MARALYRRKPVPATGRAGFQRSHLIDSLLAGRDEVICANLFTGKRNVAHLHGDARFVFDAKVEATGCLI